MAYQTYLAALAGLLIFASPAGAQAANACDLNADGKVNILDVQLGTNMALGTTPCTAGIMGAGVCNLEVVQRIINAALNGTCVTNPAHSVSLTWTASTSPNVIGYHIYRGSQSGGPYTKVTPAPVAGTTYTDRSLQAGQTYYYVATAIDSGNNESGYSNQASAVIPTP